MADCDNEFSLSAITRRFSAFPVHVNMKILSAQLFTFRQNNCTDNTLSL